MDQIIEYQVGDLDQKATRIERYCQKHFELIIVRHDVQVDMNLNYF